MAKKYLMGLDIGTDSVGWCVTDETGAIVKKSGKYLWGVRLFDQASPKAERRAQRVARRRLARRARRIDLLQMLFAKEMSKVDPLFFTRLNNSFLWEEDKDEALAGEKDRARHDALFAGVKVPSLLDMTDAKFHRLYPTIHHLRKHLMEEEEPDIRLVYLGIHHMIKYRGNFLHEGLDPRGAAEVLESFSMLADAVEVALNDGVQDAESVFRMEEGDERFVEFKKAARNTRGKRNLSSELEKIFGGKSNYVVKVVCSLLAARKTNFKDIFSYDEEIELEDPKAAIEVDKDNFEGEQLVALAGVAGDDSAGYRVVVAAKRIADYISMQRLLGNANTLSEAMVRRYEEHRDDLKWLKGWVKEHCPEKYDEVFNQLEEKKNNYARYIGASHGKSGKHCKYDDFIIFLKKNVFTYKDENGKDVTYEGDPEVVEHFYSKLEEEGFLPKQNSSLNGVFPYQLHLAELKKVIERQKGRFPFLAEETYKRKDGVEVNKLESILTWRIPYFVGPLNPFHPQHGENVWAVMDDSQRWKAIYPWSMEDQVDYGESAERFIKRMTNRCTYVEGADCLPRWSLLYTYYDTLNWLAGLQINGKPIPWIAEPETTGEIGRKEIIEGYFKKQVRPTMKGLKEFIKSELGPNAKIAYSSGKELEDKLIPSMRPWVDFADLIAQGREKDVEDAILAITLFEDKKTRKSRIKKIFSDVADERLNKISSLSYTKFGRLSREFLQLKSMVTDKETGEVTEGYTLLEIMERTGQTMMAVLHNEKYGFGEQLDRIRREKLGSASDDPEQRVMDYIEELYVSPLMKRPLIQAWRIIQEVQGKILHAPIDEFYVECTRVTDSGKKGQRTKSRFEVVESFLKEAEKLSAGDDSVYNGDLKKRLNDLRNEKDQARYRSDKLYLYFMQLGRCAYSLKEIDIHRLMTEDDYCEIDHIIPQSLVKDDSIENRVLVIHEYNQKKAARFPIPQEVLAPGARAFHDYLHRLKLIGDKKHKNLTRRKELTEDELMEFTNRQLTTTNQAVIATIDLIKTFLRRTDGSVPVVRYSKADLVSTFRQEFDILKCRDANDLHHAHDAYLNIIVGRTMWAYYPEATEIRKKKAQEALKEIQAASATQETDSQKQKTTVFQKIFMDYPPKVGRHKEPITDQDQNVVWDYGKTLADVEENIYGRQGTVLCSIRTYVDHSLFKEIGLHEAARKTGENLFPIKEGMDPDKYGGYNKLKIGFFTVALERQGKESRPCIVPVRTIDAPHGTLKEIEEVCRGYLGTSFVRVVCPIIRFRNILEKGKARIQITACNSGGSSYLAQAIVQPHYSKEQYRTIRSLGRILKEAGEKGSEASDSKSLRKGLDNPARFAYWDSEVIKIAVPKNSSSKACVLKKEDLVALYLSIVEKLKSGIYAFVSAYVKFGASLDEKKERFQQLDIVDACIALKGILNVIAPRLQNRVQLDALGMKMSGVKIISNLPPAGFRVINQSVTGFFEKVVWEAPAEQ